MLLYNSIGKTENTYNDEHITNNKDNNDNTNNSNNNNIDNNNNNNTPSALRRASRLFSERPSERAVTLGLHDYTIVYM